MSQLRLRVGKDIQSDGGPPPTVFAAISELDPDSKRKRRGQTPRREPIPISINPSDARSLELPAGHYLVEVAMPSGEILADQVEIPAGQDRELVLAAEDSPHEWLSWQHLVGNLSSVSSAPYEWAQGRPKAALSKAAAKAQAKSRAQATPTELAGSTSLPSSLYWLRNPIPSLLSAPPNDVWAALGDLAAKPSIDPQDLNPGGPLQEIPSHDSDSERAVYRLVWGAGTTGSAIALQSPHQRDFVVVPQQGTIELLSLPAPWQVVPSGGEAVVEIVLQLTANVRDFAASMTVRDDQLGVLLGYLSSGSLGAAREIAEHAKDMLYYKTMNPLAAAAGAYALVATATDNSDHEWHQWVQNLTGGFPHIPDGPIQLAQLCLRLRRNQADIETARVNLKEAYRRGLPYFTLGIRWLLDGLEKISRQDAEAEHMAKAVRQLAWRLHPQSPFTILHLGPR